MKNLINKIVLCAVALGAATFASLSMAAQEPNASILKIINPPKSIAIQIGDVLNRVVEIEVHTPYQISKNAFPVKGTNQNGIELTDVKITSVKSGSKTTYKANLSYQVFSYADKPSVMQLPAEHIAVTGGATTASVDIPAWHFWYAPLVPAGISNAKDNMQPQLKPTLIDLQTHQNRLIALLVMLVVGLIGLVYVNADKQWLPFMNGAFAQAHRKLKKLDKNPAGEQQALVYMHQAFNKTHGANLFANDIKDFVTHHPAFASLEEKIAQFFERSNATLFANKSHNYEQFINELIVLSKALRACERGIK